MDTGLSSYNRVVKVESTIRVPFLLQFLKLLEPPWLVPVYLFQAFVAMRVIEIGGKLSGQFSFDPNLTGLVAILGCCGIVRGSRWVSKCERTNWQHISIEVGQLER